MTPDEPPPKGWNSSLRRASPENWAAYLSGERPERKALGRGGKGLKRGGRIKAKRKGRTANVSDYLERNPACELCRLLGELDPPGWREFGRAWDGHPEAGTLDPHHVHGRANGDADWNLVTACRVAHEFVQSTRVGRLVCLLVKDRKNELCRAAATLALKRDPVGLVAVDLENGIFSGRCEEAAKALCQRYGV